MLDITGLEWPREIELCHISYNKTSLVACFVDKFCCVRHHRMGMVAIPNEASLVALRVDRRSLEKIRDSEAKFEKFEVKIYG